MSTPQSATPTVSPTRPAFDLVAGFTACSVFAALEMAGLMTSLEGEGLDPDAVEGLGADELALLRASLAFLRQRGLVEDRGGVHGLTEYGRAVNPDKGYMVWLVGGYGEPLRRLGSLLVEGKTYGRDLSRDGRWVANGTSLLSRADVVPYALDVLGRIPFDSVLDLGCGNARFLLRVCEQFGTRGTGIDVSPAAVEEAERAVDEAGLADRVAVRLGDVADLESIDALESTDLVMTFFLLHEILASGRDAFVTWVRTLSSRLPAGAHVLAAEIAPPTEEGGPELFTPEFTFVHALMRQRLLPADEWRSALTDGGLEILDVLPSGQPGGMLLLARNARRGSGR